MECPPWAGQFHTHNLIYNLQGRELLPKIKKLRFKEDK